MHQRYSQRAKRTRASDSAMHVPRSLARRSVGDSLFGVTNLTSQELFRPSHFCARQNDKLRVLSNESASSSSQCLLMAGVENISATAARVWRGQRSAPYGPRLILKAFCCCDLLTKLQSALAVPSATVTFDATALDYTRFSQQTGHSVGHPHQSLTDSWLQRRH